MSCQVLLTYLMYFCIGNQMMMSGITRFSVYLVCVIVSHIRLRLIVSRLSISSFIAQLTKVEGAWDEMKVVRLTA